jgi:hypothetical protein
MTQKKIDTTNSLIERGDIASIIGRYIQLSMEMRAIEQYMKEHPDVIGALRNLLPQTLPPNRGGVSLTSPFGGSGGELGDLIPPLGVPDINVPGTIRTEAPITYDYPIEGDPKGAVMNLLRDYSRGDNDETN